jgi:hypothetical protein
MTYVFFDETIFLILNLVRQPPQLSFKPNPLKKDEAEPFFLKILN